MREDLQVETLHIEATELRGHTSIAEFSYMNFWDFFLKIWIILELGKLHQAFFLMILGEKLATSFIDDTLVKGA